MSFNHAGISIAFLRSIRLCFSFSKSTEAPCRVGCSQCSGRPVVPDMRNDLLETSQDVKPTVPPQPEDSPSEEILLSSFPPAHLLLAGHTWTAVSERTTEADSSHLNEDLFVFSPGQEGINLMSPVLHTHQCWTVCTLPSPQPPGQSSSSRGREENVFRVIPPLHSVRNSVHWVTLQTGPEAWTHHDYRVTFPSCPDCVAVLTGAVNQSNLHDISPRINFGTLFA